MQDLLRFAETAECFDANSRLKLILFITGVKPSTFIHIRIYRNFHDRHEFESLLKKHKIFFDVSRAKGFEEITGIRGNAVIWELRGTWYGYDLFRNEKERTKFNRYISLVKQQKHSQADKLAGIIYGYPPCCINSFIAEHDSRKLGRYTYYQYYKRLHDSDIAFPFISHTPCSPKCRSSAMLNRIYEGRVKKWAPEFYKAYVRKRTYRVPLIIDTEHDVAGAKWKKKDGHDYLLVTQKPIEKKYYLISWLSKKAHPRGTVLDCKVALQYDYAIINVKKVVGRIKGLHHERKFAKL